MAEIGKRNNTPVRDPQKLFEQFPWRLEGLQRLCHYNNVEAVVGKSIQPKIEVVLDDIDSSSDALLNGFLILLDAIALDVLRFLQVR